MTQVSLMIHTASFDDFLKEQGINSYFDSLTQNLKNQSHKNFELIYIDTFYEKNQSNFESIVKKLPFCVKHVPVHKNHRYWYDKGYVYISAAKNTGIIYADGELLITCDDGEFFPDHVLDLYWQSFKGGHYLHAVHKRMKNIECQDGLPKFPIQGEFYINDHRFEHIKYKKRFHNYGTWTYAGTSFSLSDALKLNGFNERMDSCKSLEDCDFGNRLSKLGRNFVMDLDGYVYILDHKSYMDEDPEKIKEIKNLIALENYGIYRWPDELGEIEANKFPITDTHLEIVKRETIKYRQFDPLLEDNKIKLDLWLNTPTFDLKEERKEIRNSTEWRW